MKNRPANLDEILADAIELNELGAMPDEVVERINVRAKAREFRERIAAVREMSGAEIKLMRTRYNMSQSALAHTLGMSVESVSKWERGEIKPSGPALRILNTLEAKGPDIFAL